VTVSTGNIASGTCRLYGLNSILWFAARACSPQKSHKCLFWKADFAEAVIFAGIALPLHRADVKIASERQRPEAAYHLRSEEESTAMRADGEG
jgi:hypothetical protein